MPLEQPKRDNPLMRRYFQEIDLPGKRLARRCGVSHSQIYMARTRNVGTDNAEKISRGVASILGLPENARLRLKAEIMGHPENLVRAYLGDGHTAAKRLYMDPTTGAAVVHPTKALGHSPGNRALRGLEEMGAPEAVVEAVRARVEPYKTTPGRRTHNQSGLEMKKRRAESLLYFRLFKPKTAEAFEKSRLSKKRLYIRAGVSRETLRKAMYERVGFYSAREITPGEAACRDAGARNERACTSARPTGGRRLATAPPGPVLLRGPASSLCSAYTVGGLVGTTSGVLRGSGPFRFRP